jgi:hypothetical protein
MAIANKMSSIVCALRPLPQRQPESTAAPPNARSVNSPSAVCPPGHRKTDIPATGRESWRGLGARRQPTGVIGTFRLSREKLSTSSRGPTMADEQQQAILDQGVPAWNAWREQNPQVEVDLTKANLSGKNLSGADLSGADLTSASLFKADLIETDLTKAHLDGSTLIRANLSGAVLFRAQLIKVDLTGANLSEAVLSCANLTGANLSRAHLLGTDFAGGDLTGCRVHGISAWNLKLDGAKQKDLIITPYNEPEVTVDNLEVAQFIYLLLRNEKIRHVLDTIHRRSS